MLSFLRSRRPSASGRNDGRPPRGLRSFPEPDLGAVASTAAAVVVALVAALSPGGRRAGPAEELAVFAVAGLLAPGISQIFFTLAVRDVGASRTSVVAGSAPLFAATLAILLLDEPFEWPLAIGACLIVGAGVVLAAETARPAHFRLIGAVFALTATIMFSSRDLVVRWYSAESAWARSRPRRRRWPRECSSCSATQPSSGAAASFGAGQPGAPPLRPAGALFGLSYVLLFEAYYRGKVTVVSPLVATESLWGVLLAALFLPKQRARRPAPRPGCRARGGRRRAHRRVPLSRLHGTPAAYLVDRHRTKSEVPHPRPPRTPQEAAAEAPQEEQRPDRIEHRMRVGGYWDRVGSSSSSSSSANGLERSARASSTWAAALCGPGSTSSTTSRPGNYYGIDIDEELLTAGYTLELSPEQRLKLPRDHLRRTDRFDVDFGVQFDQAIAHSVFTHLPLNHIRLCLYRVAAQMNVGGKFFVTFRRPPRISQLDGVLRRGRGRDTRSAIHSGTGGATSNGPRASRRGSFGTSATGATRATSTWWSWSNGLSSPGRKERDERL